MHYLRQGRGFYRSAIALMLPMILQNLVTNFMALADSFMVGALGETELAAVTMANSVFYVLSLIIFGIQSGTGVLVAQYYGKGRLDAINRIMGMGYYVSLGLTALIALLAFFFPMQLMQLVTNNPDLWEPGAEYARIVGFSYVCMAFSGVYIAVQRSMENPGLGAILLTVSGALNILLNYMFIFGKWGAPAMGCAGAAVATLLSRVLEVLVVTGCFFRSKRLPVKPGLMLRPGRIIAGDFIKYSLPVVLNEGMWSLAMSLYSIIMGHMPNSTPILAAYTIAGNIDRMAAVALFAAGNATAVIIGRDIGCGDTKEIYGKGVALNFVCFVTGIISMGILLTIRATLLDGFIFPLMDISAEAGELAKMMLAFIAVVMPLRSLNLCNIVGVFRGGGDVRFGLICDIGPLYCVCLPAAALCGLVFGLGITAVYVCICLDDFCKVFLCLPRLRSGKWINSVTRETL
ncbi:MAG TPA: MATE family efflux transporter [Candidatus Scatomorpha intestinigallinarum]|uniref:MATE family efflux transporter n=2 Tax=Candidatus Scatomorpha intestinigallinarum TaxID=2840923 RepID=A0A9D1IZQ0_9FIRM|nr:MATE family efflux transporter [Candidatus Scatomorpha intestinigallinarum]